MQSDQHAVVELPKPPGEVLDQKLESIEHLVDAGRVSDNIMIPKENFLTKLHDLVNIELLDQLISDPLLVQKLLRFLVDKKILRTNKKNVEDHLNNSIILTRLKPTRGNYLGEAEVEALYVLDSNERAMLFDNKVTPLFRRPKDQKEKNKLLSGTISLGDWLYLDKMALALIDLLKEGYYVYFSVREALEPEEIANDPDKTISKKDEM